MSVLEIETKPPRWLRALALADADGIPRAAIRPASPDRDPDSADQLNLPTTMGGQEPRVSVVVPTYSDSQYLPDALQSIAAQTTTDIEVVLVDSSDEQWIADIAAEREWIRHIPTAPHGVSAARNEGIAHASGEYVAFLDVDDYWHPEKLERQLAAMNSQQPLSFTGYHFVNYWLSDDPKVTLEDVTDYGESTDVALLKQAISAHISTCVCRADVLPDRPFDESLVNFEDVLFAMELIREYPTAHVTDPLGVRRLRPDSLADRTDEIEKSRHRITAFEKLVNRYPEYTDLVDTAIARETYRIGIETLRRGEPRTARDHFRRCFRDHPAPAKAAGLYLLTFLPGDPRAKFDRVMDLKKSTGSLSSMSSISGR